MEKIKKYLWIIILGVMLIVGGVIATILIVKSKDVDEENDKATYSIEKDFFKQEFKKNYKKMLDENTDTDKDGIPDVSEKEYKTSSFTNDTDKDGLKDSDEINTYKTDPTKSDTDGDGISDGNEILAELNPLEEKTDGKTKDNEVNFEKTYEMDGVTLDIKGGATVCNVYFDKFKYGGTNTNGLMSPIFEIETPGKFDEATITFSYNPDDISSDSTANNLSVFQYIDSGKWEKVDSDVDEEKLTVSAKLKHFSKYALVDETKIKEEKEKNVLFLIDDSGSMYPVEQCESSSESDVDFKRLEMVNDLAKRFDEKINIGMASFTADYFDHCPIGSSDEDIIKATDSIKNQKEHNFNGTYILESLDRALENDEFDSSEANYIVLLTDGATTEGSFHLAFSDYTKESIIEDANDKNIRIICVGLGSKVDVNFLTEFTTETSGLYAYANNADAIDNVYNKIMDTINEEYIDSDDDGESDEILLADTGFDVHTEGLSFSNPVVHVDGETGQGICAGISIFMQMNHLGLLPSSMDTFGLTDYDEYVTRFFAKILGYGEGVEFERVSGYDSEFLSGLGFTIDGDKAILNNVYDNLCSETTKQHMEISSLPEEDRMEGDGDTLAYQEDVLDEISDNEMLDTYNFNGSWEFDGEDYSELEFLGYNFDAEYDEDDNEYERTKDIFRLFTRLFYEQYDSNSYKSYTFEENFDEVVNQLMSGNAMYTYIPGHAINAVSLTRDFNNSSIYYLYCYDNVSPNTLVRYTVEKTGNGTFSYEDEDGETSIIEFRDYRYLR